MEGEKLLGLGLKFTSLNLPSPQPQLQSAVTVATAVTTTTTALDSGTIASTDCNATSTTPISSVSSSEKPKEVTTVKSKEISNGV